MGCPVQVERIICQQEAASSLSSLISKTWGLAWNLTKVKTCVCGKAPRFCKLLPWFKSTLTPPPHLAHAMPGISPQGVFVTGLHNRIHGCLEDSCIGVRREGRVQKGGQCSVMSMLLSGLDPTWTGLKPRPSEEPSPTFSPNPQQEGHLGPWHPLSSKLWVSLSSPDSPTLTVCTFPEDNFYPKVPPCLLSRSVLSDSLWPCGP